MNTANTSSVPDAALVASYLRHEQAGTYEEHLREVARALTAGASKAVENVQVINDAVLPYSS